MVSTITSWLVSGLPRQFIEMWENRRCSILFHLLVPGGRWQTGDGKAGLGGQLGQLDLPQPGPVSVGSAAVGGDQQPPGVRIGNGPGLAPPGPDRRDGELGGVVIDADVDPAGVRADVVDP